uniref:Uncharacterized protein n=1 Tax=Oryza glumipatula TaxID=40148 RepID=A0A0D9ZMD8_9ORYZ
MAHDCWSCIGERRHMCSYFMPAQGHIAEKKREVDLSISAPGHYCSTSSAFKYCEGKQEKIKEHV